MTNKKVCVISGCSSGIGLETALQLSKMDRFKVVATMRNVSKAPSELKQNGCDIQQLDVTDNKSTTELASYLKEKYGGIDVLINNAGFGHPGSLEQVSIEDAKRVFDVNVFGVMRSCKRFTPLLRARHGGLILTISSIGGVCGNAYTDIYVASKYAVSGMMESFRYSVEKDNIKVMLMAPGPTKTGFGDRYQKEAEDDDEDEDDGESVQNWTKQKVEKLRHGQPVEKCAKAIVRAITQNMNKNIKNGADSVPLWTPTSKYSRYVVESVLRDPDANKGVYERRFEKARSGEKDEDDEVENECNND